MPRQGNSIPDDDTQPEPTEFCMSAPALLRSSLSSRIAFFLGFAPAVFLLLGLVPPATVFANPTKFWVSRTTADYVEAELDGVVLFPDGSLRVGFEAQSIELPGADVAWSVWSRGNTAWIGTGHSALVYRSRGGRAAALDSTGSGQILCLVGGPDGALYAGTAPDGRILRIEGETIETYSETGQSYVWGLAWSDGVLYAATGPDGHLLRVASNGDVQTIFRSPHGQITSVTSDDAGGCFLGTSDKGVIFWHANGRTRALFEAPEGEFRDLVYDGQVLYAAALSASATKIENSNDGGNKKVQPVSAKKEARASLVYRIIPDVSAEPFWTSPQGLIFALEARSEGGLWVATGGRGGLYAVDERGRQEAHYLAGEGDMTGLHVSDGVVWMVSSNPTRLYRLGPEAARSEVRSEVLDGLRYSNWGRIQALGTLGGVRLATRSGNTATADTTWSRWQTVSSGSKVSSPPARFLQWRAQLSGDTVLREVSVAYADVNQAPQIHGFVAHPVPGEFYKGELTPRQEPVTQILPNGQRVQFSLQKPPPGPPAILPRWAVGLRPLTWVASDPNEDPIRFRLDYRQDTRQVWVLLAEDLEVSAYTWDTSALPEGSYQLRLTASDRSTRGEFALEDRLTSRPVFVDLTPPSLAAVSATVEGREVVIRGEARDTGLYVGNVEVSLGGRDWSPASPDDGLWDGPRESFTARLRQLAPGSHAIQVRAVDAVGNATSETKQVTVEE